jgi:hypothetical protein
MGQANTPAAKKIRGSGKAVEPAPIRKTLTGD